MITVQHLTRTFGATVAVEDLSFHLEPGEVVGFLGPNGAGKTTTMRILAGFLPATSGSASVCGFDVLRESLQVRKRIGYLPEAVPLYREHRVREMLEFQGRLHGMTRAQRRERISRVLEQVGIADRSESLIGELSRGLRQRAGLAVALLPEPSVLILDEPTSGLDPLQRLEVRKLLRELAKDRTVLLSSHILSEVEAICPRVIILAKGRIAADGRREELIAKLAGASFVRMEAMLGADPAAALRLIRSLRGVGAIEDRGRLGIHQVLTVHCEEDLREDLGALAAQKGWALRELSWHRPTLEEIFARIALGIEGEAPETPAAADAHTEPQQAELIALGSTPAAAAQPAPKTAFTALSPFEKPPPKKAIYNLNPFEGGARRDLSAPKPGQGGGAGAGGEPGGQGPRD